LFFNWKIPKQKLKDGQSLIHYVVVLLVEELARKGLDMNEVLSLAKQWKLNFQFLTCNRWS
jgi:hypothetical protein